jgi:hypothetical protein
VSGSSRVLPVGESLPIRDCQYVLLVILPLVGIVGVLHNERTPQAIGILAHCVGVICPLLVSYERQGGTSQLNVHQYVPGASTVNWYLTEEPGGMAH